MASEAEIDVPPRDDPYARTRALAQAIGAVSAAAGHDPGTVLGELRLQAEQLLCADAVGIHLSDASGETFHRVHLSAFAVARGAAESPPWRLPSTLRETTASGRVAFYADFQRDFRELTAERPWLREFGSALYAPLIAADQLLGLLFAGWVKPRESDAETMVLAEGLARCAAVAVHTARLLASEREAHDDARRSRGEVEAILEAAEDAIFVVNPLGGLIRANRRARDLLVDLVGEAAPTLDNFFAHARPHGTDGLPLEPALFQRALAGERIVGELVVALGPRPVIAHFCTGPIVGEDGAVRAIVVISRDITDLHKAISRRARFDGAIKTARRVTHELSNELSLVTGYGELLAYQLDGEPGRLAQRVVTGALSAAQTLGQLHRMIRFEEVSFGGQTMLDLDAATAGSPRDEDAAGGLPHPLGEA